jgi:hypothetical protein
LALSSKQLTESDKSRRAGRTSGDQLRLERTDASARGTGATIIDWSNLIDRLHLVERVGAERYNELNAEHLKQQTVATVNGHAIRRVQTPFRRNLLRERNGLRFRIAQRRASLCAGLVMTDTGATI